MYDSSYFCNNQIHAFKSRFYKSWNLFLNNCFKRNVWCEKSVSFLFGKNFSVKFYFEKVKFLIFFFLPYSVSIFDRISNFSSQFFFIKIHLKQKKMFYTTDWNKFLLFEVFTFTNSNGNLKQNKYILLAYD